MVSDIIRERWSPAIYGPRTVETGDLRTILEAARLAPSSRNEQPWSFLVARKEEPEEFARMLSCLMPGNVTWAQHVPVLMISVAKRSFDHDGSVNRYAFHDTGIATGFLMLQAAALGILETVLGLDSTGLGLMVALFMIQDSFGTATNVTGDAALTMIIDKAVPGEPGDKAPRVT